MLIAAIAHRYVFQISDFTVDSDDMSRSAVRAFASAVNFADVWLSFRKSRSLQRPLANEVASSDSSEKSVPFVLIKSP